MLLDPRVRGRKVQSGEKVKIIHGDIIELIPGHHFFKYASTAAENNSSSARKKRASNESSELVEGEREM